MASVLKTKQRKKTPKNPTPQKSQKDFAASRDNNQLTDNIKREYEAVLLRLSFRYEEW